MAASKAINLGSQSKFILFHPTKVPLKVFSILFKIHWACCDVITMSPCLFYEQGRWKLYNIGVAGSSKYLKYWYGLMWQTVVNFSNVGVVAAIPYHQVSTALLSIKEYALVVFVLKTSNFIASSIQILQKLEDQVEYFRGDSFLIAADKKKEKNTRRLQNAERDFNASDEPRRTPGQKLG